jgi:GT2 family glycosyltransferase
MPEVNVAIILPMFNQYEFVNLCIESVYKAENKCSYTLFVLDDKSSEHESGKTERLCRYLYAEKKMPVHFFRNKKNKGFAGNINSGLNKIYAAKENYTHICLLNSDTIVSDFWLDDLVKYAVNSLVSPVSNSVGNEQIIKVDYKDSGPNGFTRESAFNFAKTWRPQHLGNVVQSKMLGFFCVLGEIELFKKVGYLEEAFGIGYYEDDDYCHRAQKLGYNLNIVRQVFVHHFGSITFAALSEGVVSALFVKNRAFFIKKHNVEPVSQDHSWVRALALEAMWISNKTSDQNAVTKTLNQWLIQPPPKNLPSEVKNVVTPVPIRTQIAQLLNGRIHDHIYWPYQLKIWLSRLINFCLGTRLTQKQMILAFLTKLKNKLIKPKLKIQSKNEAYRDKVRQLRLHQKIIVIFPIQGYFGRFQRPQHMANNLANSDTSIIWIEPCCTSKQSSTLDITKIENTNVHILSIDRIDYQNFYTCGLSDAEAVHIYNCLLEILNQRKVSRTSIKFLYQSFFWASVAKQSAFENIYDCMDLHLGFASATLSVEMLELELIRNSTKIVVTSEFLKNSLLFFSGYQLDPEIICVVKNGCNPEHFKMLPFKSQNTQKRVIGYFGAIADWFDAKLLFDVAEQLPHMEFELVGEVTNNLFKTRKLPINIKLLGEKPYENLPKISARWHCAIIPFIINDLIRATNPVKLYEYSSLGLPVVSTMIPEVCEAQIKTYCAESSVDFATKIELALKEDTQDMHLTRHQYALKNSWHERAKSLGFFIDKNMSLPEKKDFFLKYYDNNRIKHGSNYHLGDNFDDPILESN